MATTYLGVDLNNDDANWSILSTKADFVILQTFAVDNSGTGFAEDSSWVYNQTEGRKYGMPLGYYFFVTESTYNNSSRWNTTDIATIAQKDADYFTQNLGTLDYGEIVILDFDSTGLAYATSMDTYAYNFCSTVISNYGGLSELPHCLLYSSLSLLNISEGWSQTAPLTRAWPADYVLADNDWSATIAPWAGAAYPGSTLAPADYYLLQYSDEGTGSYYGSTKQYVDLDSFYSLNNTIKDWNLFGYQSGAPTTGTLTEISVADPAMHYSQPALETVVVPKYKYDQVVFADSFTTTQTSSSWPISINYPNQGNFPDTLNQYFYPIGNFSASVNGKSAGTNDFGFMFSASDPYGYGYYLGNLPQVVVQPYVNSSGQVAFDITYNPPNGGTAGSTTTIDLTINFGLLKYPGTTTPLALGNAGKSVGYQSAISGIASGVYSTYRQIANEYVVTPSEGSNSFAHGLNTIPDLFYWLIDNSGDVEIQPSTWTNIGSTASNFGLAMDSTYIYYLVDSANNQCNIRTYENT